MIDPDKSKWDDLVVVSRKLTSEDKREISEFLKAHRAQLAGTKKTGKIPRAPRKANARVKK